jgi:long-chain fatty acid transport protein
MLVVTSWVPNAHAGGMEWPDNGTRSLGRAGAFTAKADDPTAIVLNPAGLGFQRGYSLTFDSNLIQQDVCVQRAGTYPGTPGPYTYAGQPYPEVCRNLSGVFYIPMVAAAFDLGLKNWTFAIGGYGPHAVGRREFPMSVTVQDTEGRNVRAPGPTRYDVENLNVIVIFFTLAAAYRPVDWLSFGVALQIVYSQLDYSVYVPLQTNYDPDGDIRFRILTEGVAYTGLLSVLANPFRGLYLGASVRLPVKAETKGDAWINMPASYASISNVIEWGRTCDDDSQDNWCPTKHKAGLVTELPMALRTGIRYAWKMKGHQGAPDLVDIELDLVWERWSAIKSFDTQLNARMLGTPMEVFALPHHYQDVVEYRLGGSVTVPKKLGGGWLTFRLGTYYGNDASPLEYTRLDYAAWARVGVFAGMSYRILGMDLHLGFAYIWNGTGERWKPWSFKSKRQVDHSCLQPIDAFQAPNPDRCANPADSPLSSDMTRGTYHGSFLVLSLGLTVRFDELVREIKQRRTGKQAGK